MEKVNWHFDNRCNMNCRYCFCGTCGAIDSKFHGSILKKLRTRFDAINFVGGEPTISQHLPNLLKQACELGFEVSIVTNGYRLAKEQGYFDSIAPYMSTVGISVDSLVPDINRRIGRCFRGDVLTKSEYYALADRIRHVGLRLKINTVVSKFNCNEDFNDFYSVSHPDKIKVFQVLKPNLDEFKHDYDKYLITDSEYNGFLSRHSCFKGVMYSENNSQMINSYYILDSKARFLNNEANVYSDSLLDCDVDVALFQAGISHDKYSARYVA